MQKDKKDRIKAYASVERKKGVSIFERKKCVNTIVSEENRINLRGIYWSSKNR